MVCEACFKNPSETLDKEPSRPAPRDDVDTGEAEFPSGCLGVRPLHVSST